MTFDFTGKLVLVTGGSAGIGAEISKGIVAGGGHVIRTNLPVKSNVMLSPYYSRAKPLGN